MYGVVERAGMLVCAGLDELGPLSCRRHDPVLFVGQHGIRLEADGEALRPHDREPTAICGHEPSWLPRVARIPSTAAVAGALPRYGAAIPEPVGVGNPDSITQRGRGTRG
jgi:hypothetical protein